MSTPLDIYSVDMSIPFDIAAYCRGHKFSPEAVELRRAIERSEAAKTHLGAAEASLNIATHKVKEALEAVRAKMERDPA